MPWTKLDDGFHRNRKIRKAWREPRALGLYVMGLTYCAEHLSSGFVDPEWVEEQIPNRKERDRVVNHLVALNLWEPFGDGWDIHDYLNYNPSADKVAEIREARSRAGKRGAAMTHGANKLPGKLPGKPPTNDEQDSGQNLAPYPNPQPEPQSSSENPLENLGVRDGVGRVRR